MPGGGELIGRDALDRIIKRAAELQAGEHEVGEGMTKNDVLALGKDVGIPARHLQQALLEEQTRSVIPVSRGVWGWMTGPTQLSAERVVPGDRATVERALIRWMDEEESLQVKRRFPDRTTWEPKKGAFVSIQRALGARGKSFAMARATEVQGQVTQLEPGFCHVRLSADIAANRSRRLQGGGVVFGLGALGTAAFLGTFGPIGLLFIGVLGPTAVAILRQHRRDNEQVQVSLEQVLDRLERGEIRAEHALPGPRGSAFVRIAEEIRKTFQVE